MVYTLLFTAAAVQTDCGAQQGLKSFFVYRVALMKVDCAAGVALKASVKQVPRVRQLGALGKGHFYNLFIGFARTDHSITIPHRGTAPFSVLSHLWVGA